MQASLSSYIVVAASCGIFKSHNILRIYNAIMAVSFAAMNSASVEDSATVGCSLHLYPTVPPVNDLLDGMLVPRYESEYPWVSSGL